MTAYERLSDKADSLIQAVTSQAQQLGEELNRKELDHKRIAEMERRLEQAQSDLVEYVTSLEANQAQH